MSREFFFYGLPLLIIFLFNTVYAQENYYLGSEACKECHESQYERFSKYSKKARSYENIKKMKGKLTPLEYQACFECHTTGYGKKGGFISEEKTPGLKNPGCEVCHGPGALHAESGDPELILGDISDSICIGCHDQIRIQTFDHQPLMFGGAH